MTAAQEYYIPEMTKELTRDLIMSDLDNETVAELIMIAEVMGEDACGLHTEFA